MCMKLDSRLSQMMPNDARVVPITLSHHSHHIFHHVHCSSRNVFSLYNHPPPPKMDPTFFLVPLAKREATEWPFLAATKGNEIEIPQPPFITVAQTLQGLKLSSKLYNSAAAGPGWGRAVFRGL